jgi:hypothetical protein
MNSNNIVEVNMTQELAQELHAKGIYFDATSPTQLTNVAGQSITISAHFTEANHKSPAWWQVTALNFERRADSLTEVIRILRAHGIKTKIDRELQNLARAIRLTGRDNAMVNSDRLNVLYGDKVIKVVIMGFNPCYSFEDKWTYQLSELFAWLGIDSINGLKIYSPVEISYNSYGVSCEAIGVFSGFNFEWEYWRGTRTLKNVTASVWVVSHGVLLGGGVVIEAQAMRPYTPDDGQPFVCRYGDNIKRFRLVEASILGDLQNHAKFLANQSPDGHSSKLADSWLKLEQPIIDVGEGGAIDYVSLRSVGLHVK